MFLSSCLGHRDLAKATRETLHPDIIKNAGWAMMQQPQTVTDFRCERSVGGIHDFYSEGDYWWPNLATKMNPNLMYAQAIKGVATGRGIGIIDTIHLMKVAQGIIRMQKASCVDASELQEIITWFDEYIRWLMTHPYGIDEMNAQNNHGTCWVMQVAAFTRLTENEEALEFCRLRYKNILLPEQMADGATFAYFRRDGI